MSRFVALVALVAALVIMPAARPAAADPASAEAEFVHRINSLRADKGLPPLGVDPELTAIARRWSAHMADEGQLSHNPNLGNEASNWQMLGENVGYGPTVESIHRAFVDSPHHYDNLVDTHFSVVGVGVVERDGAIWVTEDFKQPKASRASPAPAPPRPAPAAAPAPARPAAAPRPARTRAPRTPAPPPTAAPTTAPAPTTTTAAPAPLTTSTLAPDVAGRQFERAEQGLSDPWTDSATLVLVSGLIIGALRTVVTATRQP
ncbi:MAG: hypothetical protein QOG87_2268 [Actinomycetota bacterium]|jgi:hypothetical protein